jgi:hypothetical protein
VMIGASEEIVYEFRNMFTDKINIQISSKLNIRYIKNISYYTVILLCVLFCDAKKFKELKN